MARDVLSISLKLLSRAYNHHFSTYIFTQFISTENYER